MQNALLRDFPVIVEFPVAWGEMDSFKHVNNIVYFRYFENARIAYFDRVEMMAYKETTGVGPILASIDCRFKAPLTYPDIVSVGVRVSQMGTDRYTMKHLVVSHRFGRTAAEGDGVLINYDYGNSRKAPIPPDLRQRILDLEKGNVKIV